MAVIVDSHLSHLDVGHIVAVLVTKQGPELLLFMFEVFKKDMSEILC